MEDWSDLIKQKRIILMKKFSSSNNGWCEVRLNTAADVAKLHGNNLLYLLRPLNRPPKKNWPPCEPLSFQWMQIRTRLRIVHDIYNELPF